MFFRVRPKMVKCKLNQSSDRGNRASLWKCNGCGHVDSQSHILYCPSYQDLRVGKDLNSDKDVANYFKDVLKVREQINC